MSQLSPVILWIPSSVLLTSSSPSCRSKEKSQVRQTTHTHTHTYAHETSCLGHWHLNKLLSFPGEVRMPSGKTGRPHITDNKDGTITIKYQPTERGLHEMDIKYDGNHIPGQKHITLEGNLIFVSKIGMNHSETILYTVLSLITVAYIPYRKPSAVLCGCCEQRSGDCLRSRSELRHGQQVRHFHRGHQERRRRYRTFTFLVIFAVAEWICGNAVNSYKLLSTTQRRKVTIWAFFSFLPLRRSVTGSGRSL